MTKMNKNRRNLVAVKTMVVFALLVTAGVFARVAYQHIPNFAPVAALALFAGYFFRSRMLAICVPLSVMLISDQLIDAGGYPWLLMLSVYGLLAVPVLCQPWLKKGVEFQSPGIKRLGTAALTIGGFSFGCSLLFFFGTNAVVWATTSLYPHTLAGLASCYAAALPFFRFTLTGDLAFSLLFFGSYACIKLAVPASAKGLAGNAS